jgi:hypothetical protein
MGHRTSRTKRQPGWTVRLQGPESLEERHLLAAVPLITEFMAVNDGVITDADGDNSDWIEISNVGDAPINLAGWRLTDNANNLSKWTFPSTPLAAGAIITVFASSKNRAVAGQELHTNFGLSSDGEYLALVDLNGTVAQAFSPGYPEQRSNVSFGLRADAGGIHPTDLRYFAPSTPGAPNGDGFLGFVAAPGFSVPHGFYNSVQNVGLTTSSPGAQIRYTVDGSTPTPSNGTLYSTPVPVDTITVLRAAAFAPGYLPSNVETQTYLFANAVATKVPQGPETPATQVTTGTPAPPPAGYPASWGLAPAFPIFGLPAFTAPGDYAIDPEIASHPDFIAGLTSIPSVSVVMNIDDLFGATNGIYTHPWQRGDDWERAGSLELIYPDGTPGFQINAGVEILGNASRQPMLSPKHSLQISFKSRYGPTELEYPLFGTGPGTVTTFDDLVVRAELSDSWVSPQGSQQVLTFVGSQGRPRAQYARDNFTRESQLAMGQLAPMSKYVHLYLNGIYWGVHDFSERRDEDFVAQHLGGDPEDYDVLQDDVFGDSGLVVQGDTVAWNAMFALANSNLSNPVQYQQIQQYLDIDKFIDYMNLHLYVGSQDWPYNNWTAVRRREPGGTFQFLTWDAEYTLQDPTTNRTGVNDANTPGQLFAALRNNTEFRLRFADRAQKLLFNGGLFTPEVAWNRYVALLNQVDDALIDESARWGDYRRDVHQFLTNPNGPYELSTRDNQWQTEKTRLQNTYFPVRTQNVINQYLAAGLYPGLAAPAFSKYGGQVATGFQVSITGPPGEIYWTLDGSDPRVTGGGVSPTAQQGTPTILQSSRLNARVKNGAVWSALESADFTTALPPIRITELLYQPAAPPPGTPGLDKDEFEFVEIKNIGSESVSLKNMVLADGVDFTLPDVSLGAGAYALIVENADAFKSRYGDQFTILGEYSGKLSNSGEKITLRDAFNQTIHSFTFVDSWYPATDGPGYSLVIRDSSLPVGTWSTPGAWRTSTNLHGSPGAADPTGVVGTKLFYKGSSKWNVTNGSTFSDDNAIAPDKTAYLSGSGTAGFSAVSSYYKGINGLMVDLAGTHGPIAANDFIFRVGNNNVAGSWVAAASPTLVTTRAGAGFGGSDRIELIWADNAIEKTWLEVTLRGFDGVGTTNANTGLTSSYVFYWGSAIGDAGAGNALTFDVTPLDEAAARTGFRGLNNRAPITNANDFNRDGLVTSIDQIIARNNQSASHDVIFLALGLATLASPASLTAPGDTGIASALAAASTASPLVSTAPAAASGLPPGPQPTPASASTGPERSMAGTAQSDKPSTTAAKTGSNAEGERELLDSLAAPLSGRL